MTNLKTDELLSLFAQVANLESTSSICSKLLELLHAENVDAEFFVFALTQAKQFELTCLSDKRDALPKVVKTADSKVLAEVLVSKSILAVEDSENSSELNAFDRSLVSQLRGPSVLLVPVLGQHDDVLAIILATSTGDMCFAPDFQQTIQSLGNLLKITIERHHLEKEYARSSVILETTSDYIGVADVDRNILWHNRHLRELRPDLSDPEEQSDFAKGHPAWALEVMKNVSIPAAIRDGIWSGELAILDMDGNEIPVSQVLLAHRGKNGEVETFSTIMRDISDRKASERALRESQMRYASLAKVAPVAIFRLDSNRDCIYVNERWSEMTGRSTESARGRGWEQAIHPEDLSILTNNADEMASRVRLQPGKIHEVRSVKPDGTIGWFFMQLAAEVDDEDKLVSYVGTLTDITYRKNVELALHEAEGKFQRVTENVPDMIYRYVIHPDGSVKFSYVNSRSKEIFGLEPQELRDDPTLFWRRMAPEDAATVEAQMEACSVSLSPLKTEFRLIFDQEVRWVQSNAQVSKRDDGTIIWDAVAVDITHQKKAEEQLQRSNLELARATHMKDQFMANMSHELRTPLSAILGLSEGLLDGVYGELSRDHYPPISMIEQSGSHLLELINEILDLTKIESGQVALNYTLVNILELGQSSLAMVQKQAEKKEVQLHFNCSKKLPEIALDIRRIKQVLINLLSNAIKFSSEGEKVTLKIHPVPPNDSMPVPMLSMTVIDSGIGIDADQTELLFQPFIQLDSDLNRKYEGTGLGLALAKRIVELHHGTIEVKSEVGVGSHFQVMTPYPCWLEPEPNASPLPLASDFTSDNDLQNRQDVEAPLVLLAEDNEANLQMITHYLSANNFLLEQATNGQQAVQLAHQKNPDIILMDINMPGMDGLTAIRELRKSGPAQRTPIIALTALAMAGDRDRCLEAGADAYLSKPVKLNDLVALMHGMIRRQ